MLECVTSNPDSLGQGCCALCLIIKGWHRYWSSSLYYLRNNSGLYLRRYRNSEFIFDDDEELPKVAFCLEHGKLVESVRSTKTDWNKGE